MNVIKVQYGFEIVVFFFKLGLFFSYFFYLVMVFGLFNIFMYVLMCFVGKVIVVKVMMGGDLVMDIVNMCYLVLFGYNLYEGIEVVDIYELMIVQEKGVKMVSFDLCLLIFFSKVDEWYFICFGGIQWFCW